VWHGVQTWRRNRYRREALAALAQLEAQLGDAAQRDSALRAVPALIKRCALVAWPRARTASLSGPDWVTFLGAHTTGRLDPALQRLLAEGEYHPPGGMQAVDAAQAKAILAGARQWVSSHRVARGEDHVPA